MQIDMLKSLDTLLISLYIARKMGSRCSEPYDIGEYKWKYTYTK